MFLFCFVLHGCEFENVTDRREHTSSQMTDTATTAVTTAIHVPSSPSFFVSLQLSDQDVCLRVSADVPCVCWRCWRPVCLLTLLTSRVSADVPCVTLTKWSAPAPGQGRAQLFVLRVCFGSYNVHSAFHWWWCRASCPRMSVDILGTNCDQCLSMVQCCFTSTETVRLIRTENPGRLPRLSHSCWTLSVRLIQNYALLYCPKRNKQNKTEKQKQRTFESVERTEHCQC